MIICFKSNQDKNILERYPETIYEVKNLSEGL